MIRRGMWVVTDNKVGIVAQEFVIYKRLIDPAEPALGSEELRVNDEAVVHLVDGKGETIGQVGPLKHGELRQAKLSEIPEPRRPDAQVAARLGYE